MATPINRSTLTAHLTEVNATKKKPIGAESSFLNACRNGDSKTVRRLLEAGASVNSSHISGVNGTPVKGLHVAAFEGRYDTTKILLDHGVRIDDTIPDGASALFLAANRNQHTVVELLLNTKANANSRRHDGMTALYIAALWGHVQTVQVLLAHDADPTLELNDDHPLIKKGHPVKRPIDIAKAHDFQSIVTMIEESPIVRGQACAKDNEQKNLRTSAL